MSCAILFFIYGSFLLCDRENCFGAMLIITVLILIHVASVVDQTHSELVKDDFSSDWK